MRSWPSFLIAALLISPLAARAQPSALVDGARLSGAPQLVQDYMAIHGLHGYDVATLPPKEIVAAAFSTDYGRALVAEFGEILAQSADKTCVTSKNLGSADFARRAGEIYQRHGTRMFELYRSALNVPAYEAALSARAPSLRADLAKLRGDPDVQKLIALEQPTRFSDIADHIVEYLTRHLLISRIKLAREPFGLARGDTSLRDRYITDEAEEERYQFVEKSRSPQLKRYIGLIKTMAEARGAAVDQNAVLRLGPRDFFGGVETDLAELCIPGVKKP